MCRRCSEPCTWPRSSTTRRTIACERSRKSPSGIRLPLALGSGAGGSYLPVVVRCRAFRLRVEPLLHSVEFIEVKLAHEPEVAEATGRHGTRGRQGCPGIGRCTQGREYDGEDDDEEHNVQELGLVRFHEGLVVHVTRRGRRREGGYRER